MAHTESLELIFDSFLIHLVHLHISLMQALNTSWAYLHSIFSPCHWCPLLGWLQQPNSSLSYCYCPYSHSHAAAKEMEMWIRLCHWKTLHFKHTALLCKIQCGLHSTCLTSLQQCLSLPISQRHPFCLPYGLWISCFFSLECSFPHILASLVIQVSAQMSSSKWGLIFLPQLKKPSSHIFITALI